MDHFATTYRNNFNWENHINDKKEKTMRDNANRINKLKSRSGEKDLLSHYDPLSVPKRDSGNKINGPKSRSEEKVLFNHNEPSSQQNIDRQALNEPPKNQQPPPATNEFSNEIRVNNSAPNNVGLNSANLFANNNYETYEQFVNAWSRPQILRHSNVRNQTPQCQQCPRIGDCDEKERKIGMKEVMCHFENLDTKPIPKQISNTNTNTHTKQEKLPSKKITMKDILYNSEPKTDGPELKTELPKSDSKHRSDNSTTNRNKSTVDEWEEQGGGGGGPIPKNYGHTVTTFDIRSPTIKQICSFCGKERKVRNHLMAMDGRYPNQFTLESNMPNLGNFSSNFGYMQQDANGNPMMYHNNGSADTPVAKKN